MTSEATVIVLPEEKKDVFAFWEGEPLYCADVPPEVVAAFEPRMTEGEILAMMAAPPSKMKN